VALVAAGAAIVVLLAAVAMIPLGGARPSGSAIVVGGSPLLGKPAPPIELLDLDGVPISLAALAGRPTVVNFWASWCEPCKAEFPLLVAAVAAHHDDGLAVLGVIHQDQPDAARRFADDAGATWPQLVDPGDAVYDAYRVPGPPLTAFIDRDGIVRAVSYGALSQASLDAQLATILPVASGPPVLSGSPRPSTTSAS
jgi:cytochrome c biogenesis protein CcmG/thiol:disulfide interchange protein DsbE